MTAASTDCGCATFPEYPCSAPATQEDLLCDACRPHPAVPGSAFVFHYQPLALTLDRRGVAQREMGAPVSHHTMLPSEAGNALVVMDWLDRAMKWASLPTTLAPWALVPTRVQPAPDRV